METAVSTRKSLRRRSGQAKVSSSKPLRLDQVESLRFSRVKTGIGELDRVLGGGIVPGSVVLLAGEPGMGKSTLLTQLALKIVKKTNFQKTQNTRKVRKSENQKFRESGISDFSDSPKLRFSEFSEFSGNTILYVCGEESPSQVKLRIERLTINPTSPRLRRASNQQLRTNFYLLPETNVESIIVSLSHGFIADKRRNNNVTMKQFNNGLIIIDSIQTLWTEKLLGLAGSVGQVRESANILAEFAKKEDVPIFLVGHVTKEGSIAGPKVLEHLVDTVLYLEGDKKHEFRILRAVKNRFGATDEVGVFVMSDKGMEQVKNPSQVFLESPKQVSRSGSCKIVAMQGIRPILVEIQALATKSALPVPRRIGRGIDYSRVQILCAVLQKKAGIPLFNQDIFLSVAGGLSIQEPAADFGICLAIASSYKNKSLPEKTVVIGEVGLLGEVRKVPFLEKRIKEAKALGYTTIIGPQQYASIGEAIRKILNF